MRRSDEEARPLLGTSPGERYNGADMSSRDQGRAKPESRFSNSLQRMKKLWPVLRVLAVAVLWGAGNFGAIPSYLDGLRAYTCSYHYSTHPELLPKHPNPKLPHDRDRPCAVSGVESKVGIVVAMATMLTFVFSSISMLYYGPKLTKWGRKPLLVLSLVSNVINYLPFVLLPLGYPFGDTPSQLSISPAVSLVVLLLCSLLTGLAGFTGLFYCVTRVMIVDVAPPTRRTVYLNWLISATLCGAFFGPLLAAWALRSSIRARTRLVLQGFSDALLQSLELPSDPTAPPIPGVPDTPSKHGNPAALVAACWVFFFAIVWSVLLLPETKPAIVGTSPEAVSAQPNSRSQEAAQLTSMGGSGSSDADPTLLSPATLRMHKLLGPLSICLPQLARNGRKDYRLTWLALAGAFSNIGTNSLQMVAVFAGYRFNFTPDAIGYLLGLIGATRAIWLIFAIPMLVLFLERTVRKSSTIAGLSPQELERLAKAGLKDPDLQRPSGHVSDEVGDQGLAQPPETERTADAEASEYSNEVIRSVVLWRVAIDVAIAKVSYFADIIGYIVVFVSASFSNAGAMIFGTLFLSFGAGAGPAVASAAMAIIQDMKSDGHPSLHPSLHPSPTDDWLAALSVSDNIVNGTSPLLVSLVYSLTIETALPSACFLIPTAGYVLSFALLSMVRTKGVSRPESS